MFLYQLVIWHLWQYHLLHFMLQLTLGKWKHQVTVSPSVVKSFFPIGCRKVKLCIVRVCDYWVFISWGNSHLASKELRLFQNSLNKRVETGKMALKSNRRLIKRNHITETALANGTFGICSHILFPPSLPQCYQIDLLTGNTFVHIGYTWKGECTMCEGDTYTSSSTAMMYVYTTVEPLYRGHHWDPAGCLV